MRLVDALRWNLILTLVLRMDGVEHSGAFGRIFTLSAFNFVAVLGGRGSYCSGGIKKEKSKRVA